LAARQAFLTNRKLFRLGNVTKDRAGVLPVRKGD